MQIPRQQLFHFISGFGCWQVLQYMAKPCVWLYAVCLGGFNQRVDDRTGIRASWCITKQPRLAANHKGADRILAAVVVDRQITALCVAHKLAPVISHIGQRCTQCALGRHLGQHLFQPVIQFIQHRDALLLACRIARIHHGILVPFSLMKCKQISTFYAVCFAINRCLQAATRTPAS